MSWGLLGSAGRRGWESGAPRPQVTWTGVRKGLQPLGHVQAVLQSLWFIKCLPHPALLGLQILHSEQRVKDTPPLSAGS